ncbi:putative anti-sigma factor [Pedobacter sp. BAL39]|uniref:FecR family protein n=1 Tax=Pedobacter sp. BAL39 TaxID=391596 RepID=UPI0001559898|nr:FecR family protein [Pedobacter sp. BAL39]EDM38909.1 putative anti-sigma factor [Pedobacter sp. BAL39]
MLEKEFQVSRLIALYFRGALSAAQEHELNLWLAASKSNRAYFDSLSSEQQLSLELKTYENIKNTTKDEVWNMTLSKLEAGKEWSTKKTPGQVNVLKLRWQKRILVAASILLILGIAITFYERRAETSQNDISQNDVTAGSNKAYITLADGKTITLNGNKSGVIISGSNLNYNDGSAVAAPTSGEAKPFEAQFLTITIPLGGQYQIKLGDGTLVYLNAGSSLKYPLSFSGANRNVVLRGEAYFEVAKDKTHPFVVKTKGQEVQVLGTHFNVNSYDDEPVIKTTLLEGVVKVVSQAHKDVILNPGEQSAVYPAGRINVKTVDTASAVAWKNGDFVFNGDDLKSVMKQLARWYNVEVSYEGNIGNIGFVSTISRSRKLSEVLNALEMTKGVHFKIEGRRILVMP